MSIPKENESIINLTVENEEYNLKDLLKEKMGISSRLFKRLIKNNGILINGKKLKGKYEPKNNDVISILFEDEKPVYESQNIDISVIYEDYDILIVNKEPNILVHPTKNHLDSTIANAVAYYFKKEGIKSKVRLVNRLDMDTSGILIIAKNPFGHQQMAKQFQKNIEKKYIAIVDGIVDNDEGIIDEPVGKKNKDSIKNTVIKSGKEAVTKYKVIERFKNSTMIELKIITGRTHQIRVHMSYIGHPIIGDSLYNRKSKLIDRQALHSYYLRFKKARENKIINVKADLPNDMKELIKKLK